MNVPPTWLHGLFAVLPTPMAEDTSLDLPGLDRVVEHYLAGGAVGLVPASIAGEGDRLDAAERRRVIERVVQRAAGRAPVIVGVLDDDTAHALAQARAAAACGAAGLLVKPPAGAGAPAVCAHVAAIAQALHLPIILLDHPKFGGALPASLVQTLAATVPEVCGIKLEDEPTPAKMARVRALLGGRIRIFGGLGGVHCLAELAHGADGFFTGCPHPAQLVQVLACWRRGEHAAAAAAYEALRPLALREHEHPAAMVSQRKTILRDAGIIGTATVRPAAGASRVPPIAPLPK